MNSTILLIINTSLISVNTDRTDYLCLNSDNDYQLDIEENGDVQNSFLDNDTDSDSLDADFDNKGSGNK